MKGILTLNRSLSDDCVSFTSVYSSILDDHFPHEVKIDIYKDGRVIIKEPLSYNSVCFFAPQVIHLLTAVLPLYLARLQEECDVPGS